MSHESMPRRSSTYALADLLEAHEAHLGSSRLARSLGDGYLYEKNPFFRRIRDATLRAGFEPTTRDTTGYFGFPLASLPAIIASRRIPYRDNVTALARLERERPGFFTLADLDANRPTPNYLLHESAHAVAFATFFGRPRNPRHTLADPARLLEVIAGEAFAMTVEYLAACAVSDPLHRWFFSISSYRRRVQGRKPVGELVSEIGLGPMVWAIWAALLYNNFLFDRLTLAQLDRILALAPVSVQLPSESHRRRLLRALRALMVMSPEFRRDTARLFLTSLGYPRDVERVLRGDPLGRAAQDDGFLRSAATLVRVLGGAG